jgi:uncharacterized membrane protein
MLGIIQDWLSLFLRWAHIIAGIGWIGSSFYFMALDASLKRSSRSPEGVTGENWSVHGGGFYHIQKYAVAPEQMPADLHWFKWESYLTWLSGFALNGRGWRSRSPGLRWAGSSTTCCASRR